MKLRLSKFRLRENILLLLMGQKALIPSPLGIIVFPFRLVQLRTPPAILKDRPLQAQITSIRDLNLCYIASVTSLYKERVLSDEPVL